MPLILRTIVLRLLLLLWALLIAWLSLIPAPPSPHLTLLGWDKFQHAAAYGVLCILVGWYVRESRRSCQGVWLLAIIITVLFGALLEVAQGTLTTARSAEISDLVADGAGALVAALCARFYQQWRRKESPCSGKK